MESDSTAARLILKATPPRLSRQLLPRARLGLDQAGLADKTLIAVEAPAGCGKTALLGQWRREALARGAAVVWLTADQDDDEARLVEGLELALELAGSRQRPREAAPDTDAGTGASAAATLPRWLAAVLALAGDVLLILDDVHTLPAATARHALATLLRLAPANLSVVLGSRRPLALSVSELIAQGRYARLDAAAMRLTAGELAAILAARCKTHIDADVCAQIHQLTEGWPLGVQLILSGLEQRQPARVTLADCRASAASDMARYFTESLIERLPAAACGLLVSLSFLDALCPDLCQAVTGRDDSAALLARLHEETAVIMEGNAPPWLRIHPMARDFLLRHFDALPAPEQRRYRANAGRWLAAHGHDEEAARHALLAGEEALAYEYAERCLYDVLATGQITRVAEWTDHIPEAELRKRPRLAIALGWTLAHGARHGEAAALVAPILNDAAALAADRHDSAQIVATAAIFADRYDRAAATIAAWPAPPRPTPVQQLTSLNLQAVLALYGGQPEQARYLLDQQAGDSGAGAYARLWHDWLIALSYLWQGQVEAAERLLRGALAEAEAIAGRRSPLAAMLGATLAATLWERGEPDEMAGLLAGRADVVERSTPPESIALSYLSAARTALLRGDTRLHYDLLERLFALGRHRGLPRLCIVSLTEQIRTAAMQGRLNSCTLNLERLGALVEHPDQDDWGMLQPLVDLQAGIAHAYFHVAAGNWQQVRQTLASVKPQAERLRRNRDWLQIQLLEALAVKHCGQDGDILLIETLYSVDALGLGRLLADTHPELGPWAHSVRADPQAQRLLKARGLAAEPAPPARLAAAAIATAAVKVAPSMLLTIKEREVIGLAARNLSNKEIAAALDLSVQTVKWHLKNLFGKLDAGNRKHMVDRARMLGIIE